MLRAAAACGVLFLAAGTIPAAASVDAAYSLCRRMAATGLLSDECQVSGWRSSVTVSIDTTGAQARQMCALVAMQTLTSGPSFKPGWTLRILSPFSGGNPIATCPLPAR